MIFSLVVFIKVATGRGWLIGLDWPVRRTPPIRLKKPTKKSTKKPTKKLTKKSTKKPTKKSTNATNKQKSTWAGLMRA